MCLLAISQLRAVLWLTLTRGVFFIERQTRVTIARHGFEEKNPICAKILASRDQDVTQTCGIIHRLYDRSVCLGFNKPRFLHVCVACVLYYVSLDASRNSAKTLTKSETVFPSNLFLRSPFDSHSNNCVDAIKTERERFLRNDFLVIN